MTSDPSLHDSDPSEATAGGVGDAGRPGPAAAREPVYDDEVRLGLPGAPPAVDFRRNRVAAAAVVGLVAVSAVYALTRTLDHARRAPSAPARIEPARTPASQTAPVEAAPYVEPAGPSSAPTAPTAAQTDAVRAGPHPVETPGTIRQVNAPTAAAGVPAPAAPAPGRASETVAPARKTAAAALPEPDPDLRARAAEATRKIAARARAAEATRMVAANALAERSAARIAPQARPTQALPAQARGDCRAAGGRVARMLCENPDLAAADRRLQRLYRRALEDSYDPDEVRDRQSVWLAARDAAARDGPDAVAEVYESRIEELRREGR